MASRFSNLNEVVQSKRWGKYKMEDGADTLMVAALANDGSWLSRRGISRDYQPLIFYAY
jgi:hypothetical protein